MSFYRQRRTLVILLSLLPLLGGLAQIALAQGGHGGKPHRYTTKNPAPTDIRNVSSNSG